MLSGTGYVCILCNVSTWAFNEFASIIDIVFDGMMSLPIANPC